MKVLIPTNFNIDHHINTFPPEEIIGFSKDKLHYLIGLPFTILANNKDLRIGNGYVPLNATKLKNEIGNDYWKYLEYLVETDVFETNGQYKVGVHSRKFRYGKAYRNNFKEVELGQGLIKKFTKAQRKRFEWQMKQPEYQKIKHLRSSLTSNKLKLDMEAAEQWLHEKYLKGKARLYKDSEQLLNERFAVVQRSKQLEKHNDWWMQPEKKERLTTREKLLLKYFRNLQAAKRLTGLNGNVPYFELDEKAFRLHTPLTSLKKELRHFLTYDGKWLVEVDVSCSQLFFSLALLDVNFYETGKGAGTRKRKVAGKESIAREIQEDVQVESQEPVSGKNFKFNSMSSSINEGEILINTSISFNKLLKLGKFQSEVFNKLKSTSSLIMFQDIVKDIDKQELRHYKKQVVTGKLYDYLLKQYIKQTGKEDMDRDSMKKVIFTILFSKNENEVEDKTVKELKIGVQRQQAKEIFRSCFPTIMHLFEKLKEGQNNLLALLLQSIEAHVMLEKVCWRIRRERLGLPLFTIHDSILTTVGNQAYIQRVMEEEFQKAMGVIPKLDTKERNPENVKRKQLKKKAA